MSTKMSNSSRRCKAVDNKVNKIQTRSAAKTKKSVKAPKKIEDSNQLYRIEEIKDKKINDDGTEEYLIKWEGYSSDQNTWEPKENIECEETLKQFEKEWAKKNQKVEAKKPVAQPKKAPARKAPTKRALPSDSTANNEAKRPRQAEEPRPATNYVVPPPEQNVMRLNDLSWEDFLGVAGAPRLEGLELVRIFGAGDYGTERFYWCLFNDESLHQTKWSTILELRPEEAKAYHDRITEELREEQ